MVVKHANSQRRGCLFDSSMYHNKTPWMRKARGNHVIKSTSLENLRALSLVSATLEVEYPTQYVKNSS